MKDISEWLGHADISTTMNIYGHISMEHKRIGTGTKGYVQCIKSVRKVLESVLEID